VQIRSTPKKRWQSQFLGITGQRPIWQAQKWTNIMISKAMASIAILISNSNQSRGQTQDHLVQKSD
jgi:hypothetical protein